MHGTYVPCTKAALGAQIGAQATSGAHAPNFSTGLYIHDLFIQRSAIYFKIQNKVQKKTILLE